MDRFYGRRDLREITPENFFWDSVGDSVAESICRGKMVFDEGFGKGEVVGDENEGTVSECAGCECVNDRHHISVVNSPPVFDGSNGILVRQTITCH